ncbi:hypothetical protein, partial [Longimicrobium sp.]|uniref:hypothetical protein n=1 Tax=Longimicrobium sp. TaxID=2029185 RepID=UPI002E2EB6A7
MRPPFHPVLVLPLLALLSTASCGKAEACTSPEACDLTRAARLATGDSMPAWPVHDAGKPVLLYVDRSQGMRGFLDPGDAGRVRTEYRSVLDGFAARLRPRQVAGFGTEVRVLPRADLGVLADAGFYTDGNTELEEVLRMVEADSARAATHVILGDGRRTDPDAGIGQFARMRTVSERWTADGGTFVVAASLAPFKPVGGDVSSCRPGDDDAKDARQTCPLYAFAFVAPGDEGRVAAALAATFDDLFVT